MPAQRRTFTEYQKVAILKEAADIGINAALRKHSLSYSAFFRWRNQLMEIKPDGGKVRSRKKTANELMHYKEENILLKKIVAEQALEMMRREQEMNKLSIRFQ